VAVRYTDVEIADLIATAKSPTPPRENLPELSTSGGHERASALFIGEDGNQFRVILRRSRINPFDFSAILTVRVPNSTRYFRLLRYNGRSHPHRNHLEGTKLHGFHIHRATERYQRSGHSEDAYAESTDRYDSWEGAVSCLLADAQIKVGLSPKASQIALFPETPT